MKGRPAPEGLHRGILAALAAALLFGASTPFAKLLVGDASPWLLAGLLYLGSGVGLALLSFGTFRRFQLAAGEAWALAGAIAAGGIAGPVLLMGALAHMPASSAALLLNAEAVFTALIAWFVFKENFDRRIALGMLLIVAGAVVLSGFSRSGTTSFWPALAVLGACLAWAIDNNLTRKVSLADPRAIAMLKGLAAGGTNTALAMLAGATLPRLPVLGAALLVGWLGYGVSLALFVVALRELGTARTAAYFSTAPFAGAVFAVLLGESVTVTLFVAAALMAAGVWLHVSERHEHRHTHEPLEHAHEHEHDEHHRHEHQPPVPPGTRHTHAHRHEGLTHEHAHYPDAHHRHGHSP